MRCHIYTTEEMPYRVLLTSEGLVDFTYGSHEYRIKPADIKYDYTVRAKLIIGDGVPRRMEWEVTKIHKDLSSPFQKTQEELAAKAAAMAREEVEAAALEKRYLSRPGVADCK